MAELKRLAVANHWRRRGLATMLVRAAEARCREQGVALLTLTTLGAFDSETAAHAFYLRAGYRHVAEGKAGEEGGAGGVELARFEKVLSGRRTGGAMPTAALDT